jgi:hypothetical protein
MTVSCKIDGAVTGTPSFASWPTLPITASANMPDGLYHCPVGTGGYNDSGTTRSLINCFPLVLKNSTVCQLGTSTSADYSATVPITWASPDRWWVYFSYEI